MIRFYKKNKLDCFAKNPSTASGPFYKGGNVHNDEKRERGKQISFAKQTDTSLPSNPPTLIPSKKAAFTLAETLITLAIIGVVAALTMPTLVANYQEKAQVIQIRKLTNDFINALDTLITEEGKSSIRTTSIFNSDIGLENFMTSKFNATPCESATCFAQTKYKSFDKSKEKEFICEGKAYLLANSAAICIKKAELVGGKVGLDIYTDTNGRAKPNTGGKDMFGFTIDDKLTLNSYGYGRAVESTTPLDKLSSGYKILRASSCADKPFGDGCVDFLKNNNWKIKYEDKKQKDEMVEQTKNNILEQGQSSILE